MLIGSVVWEEFYHIHTYTHTHGIALSIRVTLNTKPASQVLTSSQRILTKGRIAGGFFMGDNVM